jgi:hypothetical protein
MSNAATNLAARLSLMILGATGASVRAIVSDRVLIIASTEADRDAAATFIRAQRGFDAGESFECRGTYRASFRPAA